MAGIPLAVVFGCEGTSLKAEEARFFRESDPLGFILFARNCADPAQVTALVSSLREAVGRADAPVLIDQEGGRVARLKPPHWPAYNAPRTFGDIAAREPSAAAEAVRLNSALIGADLRALGITVNCAPSVDVPVAGAHEMIGTAPMAPIPSRSLRSVVPACEGFLAANVLPVVKHLLAAAARVSTPQCATEIDEPLEVLDSTDFVPFRMLADML